MILKKLLMLMLCMGNLQCARVSLINNDGSKLESPRKIVHFDYSIPYIPKFIKPFDVADYCRRKKKWSLNVSNGLVNWLIRPISLGIVRADEVVLRCKS